MPRYLTKSRFKLALECPTKLHYTGNPDYLDNATGNTFMAALAEGGYQVGALACAMHPEGVLVDAVDHDAAVAHTLQLLARDTVTVFEAALRAGNLFVRVDILRKRGDNIELIEVKAKSYDPAADADFRNGKGGALSPKWLPYLNDVAFQTHVARLALPAHWRVRSALMLADKSATASVAGLNQRFRVRRQPRGGTQIVVAPGTKLEALGVPLLRLLPVDDAVTEILAGTITVSGRPLPFAPAVRELADAYVNQVRLATPPGARCGACQFKAPSPPSVGQPRSGFHECWSQAFRWTDADFAGGTVLDLWNSKGKAKLIEQGVLHLRALTMEHLKLEDDEPGVRGMSANLRQWYQCHGGWPGGGEAYFDAEGMAAAMREWRWPLHFIDFETSSVAIPFDAGRRPYETIAFQFSHHVMHEDGRVEHRSQFLEATPGVDPCLPFLRALREALSGDQGTVFRWADHENTVLNQLRRRLLADTTPPGDRDELVAFIETITSRKQAHGDGRELVIHGPRCMVDLCKLAERHYFHPSTRGSSSLKKVLPALMRSSAHLRELYEAPSYGGRDGIPSLNFRSPVAWWVAKPDGTVCDPYELLPPVFAELSPEQQSNLETAVDAQLHEGGAAMTAYARLQFEDIDPAERQAIHDALLKYCELDTLAMVMAMQAWRCSTNGCTRTTAMGMVRR